MNDNNAKAQFYKQPRYYDSFSCIGGSCPMSCCLGWRVDWVKNEIEKLKSAECSDKLRTLIDNSFMQFGGNSEKFLIKMDDKKRCPFLTEDNFCSIQRELGAEYLSHTCTIYPRNSMLCGNTILKYCNLSCYRIMDILCSESDCMVLENRMLKAKKTRVANMDNSLDFMNHPELKYRQQLFDFFYEIISDDSHSIEISVILGALAAQSISKLIEKGAYDKIPESIQILKKQLENPEQIKKLENITPNYAIKLGFASEISSKILRSDMIKLISEEDGGISVAKYNDGIKKFK
ncbi:MAG: flagellin lysine-N-methylase, partial [Oscillospiraceae bacterium]|nr:flagellin lysine-N-methylase [Oscillospiraceae bacterium]